MSICVALSSTCYWWGLTVLSATISLWKLLFFLWDIRNMTFRWWKSRICSTSMLMVLFQIIPLIFTKVFLNFLYHLLQRNFANVCLLLKVFDELIISTQSKDIIQNELCIHFITLIILLTVLIIKVIHNILCINFCQLTSANQNSLTGLSIINAFNL